MRLRRHRDRSRRPPRLTARQLREALGDWLMLLGAVVLFLSLFLTWSHQFSPAFAAAWGSLPALRSVPRDPTGWQVYSAADVCLALVAAGLVGVAFLGTRRARLTALVPAALALAFVLHAGAHPPTNGVNLNLASPGAVAVADHPTAGSGETVALAGLSAALAGLLLSFTAD